MYVLTLGKKQFLIEDGQKLFHWSAVLPTYISSFIFSFLEYLILRYHYLTWFLSEALT